MTNNRLRAGFAGWAVVGFLVAAALLSIASIGVYILPVALVALVVVARVLSFGRGTFGAMAGVGAALLVVAVRSSSEGGAPCTVPSTLAPGQLTSVTCGGGVNATPWYVVGAVALVLAAAGVWLTRGRQNGTATLWVPPHP
ncbi:MAG: hypothetical protein ABIM89_04005 [Mycobacteriales bacterium]